MKIGYAAMVKETTTESGTILGFTPGGAVSGFKSFADAFGTSLTDVIVPIMITDGTDWELLYGTYDGTTNYFTTLGTSIVESSNNNSRMNWPDTSTKEVYCVLPPDLGNSIAASTSKAFGFSASQYNTVARSSDSVAIGRGVQLDGNNSIGLGRNVRSDNDGRLIFGAGDSYGRLQHAIGMAKLTTTNDTSTVLGSFNADFQHLALYNYGVISFKAMVTGRNYSSGDILVKHFSGAFRFVPSSNGATTGTYSIIGSIVEDNSFADAGATHSVAVTIDGTNGLTFTVTGTAGATVYWHVHVDMLEGSNG